MKEYQYFRVELEGHIATITISRPKALNALSWDLVTELETVIDDVSAMEDVWVVIFTVTVTKHSSQAEISRKCTS